MGDSEGSKSKIQRPAGSALSIVGQAPAPAERADAARNRARILDAARKLLGRRSIHDICMDELAQAAGVGKGTLYRRFVDRSSLCHALLDDNEKNLQTRVLRNFDLPTTATAVTRLRVMLTALFDFVVDNAALLAEARAFERAGAERHEHPVHVWRRHELSRLLAAVVREEKLPNLDVFTAAEFLLAPLEPDLLAFQLKRGMSEVALRDAYLRHCLRAAGITSA